MVTELNPQDRQHAAGLLNRAGLTFDARDVALVAAAIRQFEIEASARIRAVTPLTDSINSGWELGFKRGHPMPCTLSAHPLFNETVQFGRVAHTIRISGETFVRCPLRVT